MDDALAVDAAAGGDDPGGTFLAVVAALGAWEPAGSGTGTASRRVRSFLEARLNDGTDSPWERDVVERRRGSAAADLAVNGEIGVTLVDDVGPATAADLRVALPLLAERYNFVVVYWLDASAAAADYRRSVERGASADRLGVDDLRFVTAPEPTATAAPVEPFAPARELRGVAAVALLLALGVGAVGWSLLATTGFGRALLAGVAGLFAGTLALATFLAGR